MNAFAILLATLKFVCWEAAILGASLRLARVVEWRSEDRWLAILAIDVTLESSIAGIFSFAGWNSAICYWVVAAICAVAGGGELLRLRAPLRIGTGNAFMAALAAPLVLLAFRPIQEIDSMNDLHYLIEWMGNRSTPFLFATNYVAFWELSFVPAWVLTGMDWFFPLLELKSVVLLAFGAWLVGRELGLRGPLLAWGVFAAITMRHYWFGPSGVPTVKNDALHGAGFLLLTLAVMRMVGRKRSAADTILLSFGVVFATVKYTGLFLAAIALVMVRGGGVAPYAMFLATSGPYYLRNLARWGSPFYPFQIKLGPLHLPGTADLSYTSILYHLGDARVWKLLFLPEHGVSPAGLLLPVVVAVILPFAAWRSANAVREFVVRRAFCPKEADLAAFLILCGWLLYFRSVYSAGGGTSDVTYLGASLNSIRYVDGVLAASEMLLLVWLARWPVLAWGLVAVQLVSRLLMLYLNLSWAVIPVWLLATAVVLAYALSWKRSEALAGMLVLSCPWLVERNRVEWTSYWNDLKPALAAVRDRGLGYAGLEDGGYYAGHVVAAGNPVRAAVRSLMIDDWDKSADLRPPYLAILVMPGSGADPRWRERDGPRLLAWGYRPVAEGRYGAIFARAPQGSRR